MVWVIVNVICLDKFFIWLSGGNKGLVFLLVSGDDVVSVKFVVISMLLVILFVL